MTSSAFVPKEVTRFTIAETQFNAQFKDVVHPVGEAVVSSLNAKVIKLIMRFKYFVNKIATMYSTPAAYAAGFDKATG